VSLRTVALIAALAVAVMHTSADAQATKVAVPAAAAKLKRALKAQMVDSLRDPESARVERDRLYLGDDGNTVSLCGLVNAKNAFGGYSGKKLFVSTSTGMVLIEGAEGVVAGFSEVWETWCAQAL
jgi:hypothetical protein